AAEAALEDGPDPPRHRAPALHPGARARRQRLRRRRLGEGPPEEGGGRVHQGVLLGRALHERGRLKRTVCSLLAAALLAACTERRAPDAPLFVFMDRDVEGLDPHLSGELWQTQSVLSNLYEPLVTVDGQMALTPALA